MKHMTLFFIFSLFLLIGCQESSKKSSSSSSSNNYCAQNPYAYGCYGTTTTGTTTSGTTTGTTDVCYQSTNNYWNSPGCPGFCQNYPAYPACGGTTTSGSTTGSTSNPYGQVSSNPIYQNWGVQYPGTSGNHPENCSATYVPSGINFTPYETRKATMSIAGSTWYNPSASVASQYLNTSALLKSVTGARQLFQTDSVLKVRFAPRQQPPQTNDNRYCYVPGTITGSTMSGYTKLNFTANLVGVRANGTVETEPLGSFTTVINNCTPAIDLSSYASRYPGGIYVTVSNVMSNQLSFPYDYAQNGFENEGGFSTVSSSRCWTMDVEVAADGTKTFD